MKCHTILRTGRCQLDTGHKGRHSTVTFYCDKCGVRRRGTPHAVDQQLTPDGYYESNLAFCFMCCVVDFPD